MSQEYSQEQLEEMVDGKKHDPRAVFFDKATIDVSASKEAGKRVYKTLTYIKETQPGVTDWVAISARPEHKLKYTEEYEYYLHNRQGVRSPSITIIPNISPAESQELIDYGLSTIKTLAKSDVVPKHLEHIRKAAIIIQATLEQSNVTQESKEESIEEEGSITNRSRGAGEVGNLEHGQLRGRGDAPSASRRGIEIDGQSSTHDVPASDRLDHTGDVGRSIVEKGSEGRTREATGEPETGGRVNGSGYLSPNWSISIN